MLRDCFVGTFSGEKARDFVAYCARNFHLERIWIERNSGRFKGKQFGIGLDFDWSVLFNYFCNYTPSLSNQSGVGFVTPIVGLRSRCFCNPSFGQGMPYPLGP